MDETLPKGRHTPSISSQSESGLGIDNLEHDSHAPAVEVTDASDQRRLLSPNSTYMPSPASPYQAEHLRNGLQLSPSWQSTMSTPDGVRACRSRLSHRQSRLDCGNILILTLTTYAFVFSGIWLGLAIRGPHYRTYIQNNGRLAPNTASILVAGFAKTIELSFVAVFIAFLGQYLSRRSLSGRRQGMTISDMQLRTLILQPGAVLIHFGSFLGTWRTWMGALATLATLAAIFYTTASDALVSPKLQFQDYMSIQMKSLTQTTFADNIWMHNQCLTPVSQAVDDKAGIICTELEHSGQAYHNFMQYLNAFNVSATVGNVSATDMAKRPPPIGMLFDNTTVEGIWSKPIDAPAVSKQFNRTINNVTMQLPHAALFGATKLADNDFTQPALDGFGEFYVDASVLSPTINVLCANASAEELTPIIFGTFPKGNETFEADPDNFPFANVTNTTALDPVFGWGKERTPPVFSVLPSTNNTVFGHSQKSPDAMYILAATNSTTSPSNTTIENANYMVCSLAVTLEAGCSTILHSTFGGNNFNLNCAHDNPRAHKPSTQDADGAYVGQRLRAWYDVALDWAFTLSLDAGHTNANAATGRILAQFIPTVPTLSTSLPSIAEALAVLSACTLLNSAIGAPQTANAVSTFGAGGSSKVPRTDPFDAWVRMQDYASGMRNSWQGIFFAVLGTVFVLSGWCLFYFVNSVRAGRMVTDFVEPQNLFALAMGSPPSASLDGACGAGPTTAQMLVPWWIRVDGNGHVVIGDGDKVRRMRKNPVFEDEGGSPPESRDREEFGFEDAASTRSSKRGVLGRRKYWSLLSGESRL